jgi:plastocyanin
MRSFTILLLTAILLVNLARADAVIEGHVDLPKPRTAPILTKRYEIVAKGGVLSTNPPVAILYLEGNFPAPAAALPVQQIIQKDYLFQPAILPVRTGTKVEFPNQDTAYHNVFSFSPAKRFDLGRYRPEDKPIPSQLFDKPGIISLRCDIHEHMRGIILVLDTPYFVLTKPDGTFRLPGLPAGTYKLKAWLDSRTTLEKPVTIPATGTTKLSFP